MTACLSLPPPRAALSLPAPRPMLALLAPPPEFEVGRLALLAALRSVPTKAPAATRGTLP